MRDEEPMRPPSNSDDHLNPGDSALTCDDGRGGINHGDDRGLPTNRSGSLPPTEKISLKGANPQVEDVLEDYRLRLDDLVDAFWPDAVAGEHKSAELVRKLLQQRAALFGIGGSSGVTVSSAPDEGEDELAKLRSRRAGT